MSDPTLGIAAAFRALVEVLDRAQVRYAFIGAVPVLVWGRVRTTTDLDVVAAVSSERWPALEHELNSGGFVASAPHAVAEDGTPDIARFWADSAPAVAVDLFVAKTTFEDAVLATARRTQLLGREVPVASPEASIIYKLIASRPHDHADVRALFDGRRAAGAPLDWSFLEHWAREWEIEDRLAPYRDAPT